MKFILIASLCVLPIESSEVELETNVLERNAAMDILRDSVDLELTDYMELQSTQMNMLQVDSFEAEANFLHEEHLAQFSDELELESNLSLGEVQLISEKDEEQAENIAPSRALSVRYLGSESVRASSPNHAPPPLNQDIIGVVNSDTSPVNLLDSNSPALTDYSVEEGDALVLPEGSSTATPSKSVPVAQSNYATPSASISNKSSSTTAAGTQATSIGYQSRILQTASNNTDPELINLEIPFEVDGRVLINANNEADMRFTSSSEVTGNFNIKIQGINISEGNIPILDGGEQYRGFELYYYNGYTGAPTITFENLAGMENFIKTRTGDAMGGAISLVNGRSKLIFNNDPNSPVTFQNNHVTSTSTSKGSSSGGGAIFISGGGSIGNLRANFINNTASTLNSSNTASRYARGGAIAVGYPDDYPSDFPLGTTLSTIGTITGDFTDNKATFGGAIYTGAYASISNIIGNFTRNIAEGYMQSDHASRTGADGGAFRTYKGSFGSISGNFTNNISNAFTGNALGGSISLYETSINGTISGDFLGNKVFAAEGSAWGGALSIRNQSNQKPIQLTDVSFFDNIAGTGTSSTDNVKGAAIYISNSTDVTITANNKNVVFSNNYTVTNATITKNINGAEWTYDIEADTGVVRDYTAIYLDGSNLTLETTAGSDKTITIDDGITASATTTGILTVKDASHSNVENEYGVFLNGELGMDQLIVETGGVQLGSAVHSDGSTSTGSFINHANVHVKESARIRTNADYLAQVGDVILDGTNRNNAALLNLTGGTLTSDINKDTTADSTGTRTGHIAITGSTILGLDEGTDRTIIYSSTLSLLNTLELQRLASIDTETIFFYGSDKSDVNQSLGGTNHIIANAGTSFSFSKIELNFGAAYIGDIFEIIVGDGSGMLTINYDLTDLSKITILQVNGRRLTDDEYEIRRRTSDGGIEVEILRDFPPVPEPSTVTLSLIALASFLCRRRRS